jgi:hypothetical protein
MFEAISGDEESALPDDEDDVTALLTLTETMSGDELPEDERSSTLVGVL